MTWCAAKLGELHVKMLASRVAPAAGQDSQAAKQELKREIRVFQMELNRVIRLLQAETRKRAIKIGSPRKRPWTLRHSSVRRRCRGEKAGDQRAPGRFGESRTDADLLGGV